jgi:tetratricopeptide (TPR) repeat protein
MKGFDAKKEGGVDSERLAEAILVHEELVDRFPGLAGLDEVLFRLGTLLKISGDLEEAHEAFIRILERFLGSPLYSDAITAEMEIARKLLGGEKVPFLGLKILGGSSLGAEILEKVLDVAPFSRFGPEALYRLGNYCLDERKFEEAVVHFETLVRRFPDDDFRIKAEFQAARSYFLRFSDLSHDLAPLEESLNRFRAFIEIHSENPSEIAKALIGDSGDEGPGKEKSRPTGAWAFVVQIQDLLALKNLETGDWYRARGYDKAARAYYRYTLEEFPNTAASAKAGRRLEDLPEPAEPEKAEETKETG